MGPTLIAVTLSLFTGCVTTSPPQDTITDGQVYRAGIAVPDAEAVAVEEAIAQVSDGPLDNLVLGGTVDKVCQAKGCWLTIKTARDDLRVTFKDYGFFVPLSAQGKQAKMVGTLSKTEVTVRDQRHYLEDAGASEAEIAAVTEPKLTYSFVASGVEILP